MYYVGLCFVAYFLPLVYGETKIINDSNVSKSNLGFRNAEQAARVAVHYLNYQEGSPNAVYDLHELKKHDSEVILDLGIKYHLQFEVDNKDISMNVIGNCTAIVIFNKKNARPYTNVNCNIGKKYQRETARKDLQFYLKMIKKTTPAFVKHIPDNFGMINPKIMPFWHLARIAASYIMWEKSTENLAFNMGRLQKMNQLEIITCYVGVNWYPNLPLNPKYHCVPLSQQANIVEGSGVAMIEGSTMEEGSAMN